MNPKLLLMLSWLFYLAVRRTHDEIWLFCLICSSVLTICAFFYRLENCAPVAGKKRKKR